MTSVQIVSEREKGLKEEIKEINEGQEKQAEEEGAIGSATNKCYSTNPMVYVTAAFFLFFSTCMSNNSTFFFFITRTKVRALNLIGIYEALEGFCSFLGMVIMPFVIKWLFGGYIDIVMILWAYVSRIAFYLQLALASTNLMVMFATAWLLFAAVVTPRSRAVISRCVSQEHQADALSGFFG